MENTTLINTTLEEFIFTANKLRKANAGKWFTLQGNIGNRTIAIKNYSTYLQIYRIDGRNYASGLMDMPVKKWLAELQSGFELALQHSEKVAS